MKHASATPANRFSLLTNRFSSQTNQFSSRTVTITPTLLAAAMAGLLLTACGGGGGGGGSAKSASSAAINESNDKRVVAAIMNSIALDQANSPNADDSEARSAALLERSRQSMQHARVAREALPEEGACGSGRMLIDDVTGETIFDNCVWSWGDKTVRVDGTRRAEDLRGDATSAYHTRFTYTNYSLALLLSPTDHITNVMNGVTLDSFTDIGSKADVDLRSDTTFLCRGVSGNFSSAFKLASETTVTGPDSSYVENGEMTFTGFPAFSGTLTVTTLEPMRYRDAYNDEQAYDGRIRFAAADGSAVEIRFALGGLYVNGHYYTWAEYRDLFVIDEALAPCIAPK